MSKRNTLRAGAIAALTGLAVVPAVAGAPTPAHAAAPRFAIHRQVHFAGRMEYQDGSAVPQATVYVLPYGADDTNQAYEHFQAYNGYYQTPELFNAVRRYTIYIVCTGPDGQQYSYSNDFAAHPSNSYNEYEGTAYMEPDDNGNSYGGGNGND